MAHDFDARLTGQATDLAALLLDASPGRAYSFALAMHERACQSADEAWTALWLAVLAVLKQRGDDSDAAPDHRQDARRRECEPAFRPVAPSHVAIGAET